jgi:hypothetical protein
MDDPEVLRALAAEGYEVSFKDSATVTVDAMKMDAQTAVVPVMFRRRGTDVSTEGTAFCLASLDNGETIFVTATHVVDSLDGADDIEAFVILPRGTHSDTARRDLHGIRVEQLCFSERFSDVALITVTLKEGPTPEEMRPFRISLTEPVVGQRCMALGYPQKVGEFGYSLTASEGEIAEIHPSRRDAVLSTFPSFRTTANYLPSMSGGPILAQNGHVIGVVSIGMDTSGDEQQATGYGACVACISEFKVDLHTDDGVLGGFNWSSQHLDFEELRWLVVSDDGRIGRAGLRCGRRVGRQWHGASIGSGSGRRSLTGRPARTPGWRPACRRRWGLGGSVRVAACR